MTAVFTTKIEIDSRGVAWLAGTRTKVKEVVLDKLAHGWSPDEMHDQHPHLSLAQIHAALTYYYENQAALDEQMRKDDEETDRLLAEICDKDLQRKLKNLNGSL